MKLPGSEPRGLITKLLPSPPPPVTPLSRGVVVALVFDLVYRTGEVSARSLRDRRTRLEDVVAGSELVFPVRRLAADGLEAWKQVVGRGYEGDVAKDDATAYEGDATRAWLKVKRRGWTVAEGRSPT